MKRLLFLSLAFAFFISCNTSNTNSTVTQEVKEEKTAVTPLDVNKSFDELFKSVQPNDLDENVFKVTAEDYAVITAGTLSDYNSMVASYGGWGILFGDPVTWCFLRANRYTLEYMRANEKYTFAYFDAPYKEKIMHFGTSSGRGTDKMKTHDLTAVETPNGSISYKEARFIIECELVEITTVSPDDFYSEKGKNFVIEGFEDAKEYHKLVFGKITNIWERK
ncbi:MAG: flavin reductase [Odoribacter sp.]|nr:flavin reductase [Odoribacter sp.]